MPVHDLSYRRWKGRFERRPLRWLPMVRYHVKLILQRRLVWMLLFFSFAPALVLSVLVYVASQEGGAESDFALIREIMARHVGAAEEADIAAMSVVELYWLVTRYGYLLFLVLLQSFMVLVITSVVGSGLVAKDVRSNALEIYLTKPITSVDYVLGKLAVIFVFVFLVTFVPSVLVFTVASALWEGYFTAAWKVLLPLSTACLIAAFVNGMVILGLSSLAKSARYATVIWFALCFITGITGNALYSQTDEPLLYLVSYRASFAHLFSVLFGGEHMMTLFTGGSDPFDVSLVWPIAILSGYVGLSALIMRKTIHTVGNR